MSLNAQKTVCIIITHITYIRRPLDFNDALLGNSLTKVVEYKYLGVAPTFHLKWNQHIGSTVSRTNKRLGFIHRTLKLARTETKLIAFKRIRRPILEYVCEAWDPYANNYELELESVQHRAPRSIYSRYRRLDILFRPL